MPYRIVSAGKQFHVSYRIPADQVPSGKSVYLDILDKTGAYTGNPIEMTRVGSTDIVEALVTAPSTPDKYILMVWIGTWDGTTRTIDEVVDYTTLIVVDKDVEDKLADIENRITSLETEVNTLKKLVVRHWA